VELGAEFIHGAAPHTWRIVESAGLTVCDAAEEHVARGDDGRIAERDDFAGGLEAILDALGVAERDAEDPSFAEWVTTRFGDAAHAGARRAACAYVEGYHAGPADEIGVRGLARAEGGASGNDQAYRIPGGYEPVLRWLATGAGAPLDVRLGARVERVRWRAGAVTVHATGVDGRALEVAARTAVITLPLGVLAAPHDADGAVAFDPPLDAKRAALAGLGAGDALRVVLRFADRWWEEPGALPALDASVDPAMLSFVHAPGLDVPVWWTQRGVRAPLLVGWAGGPAARALLARPERERVARGVAALATLAGLAYDDVARRLTGAWAYDWTHDPLARGAYSFARPGGADAPAALGRPLDGTLFFAGEATATEGLHGTVEGALASGERAAAEAHAALGERGA
jgi:monoamine oxidase